LEDPGIDDAMIALFHFLVEICVLFDKPVTTSGQVLKALEMARVKQRTDGGPAFTFPQCDQEVVAMCEMYLDRKGEFSWNLWQKIAVIFLPFFWGINSPFSLAKKISSTRLLSVLRSF